jgi:hypothetical protein
MTSAALWIRTMVDRADREGVQGHHGHGDLLQQSSRTDLKSMYHAMRHAVHRTAAGVPAPISTSCPDTGAMSHCRGTTGASVASRKFGTVASRQTVTWATRDRAFGKGEGKPRLRAVIHDAVVGAVDAGRASAGTVAGLPAFAADPDLLALQVDVIAARGRPALAGLLEFLP